MKKNQKKSSKRKEVSFSILLTLIVIVMGIGISVALFYFLAPKKITNLKLENIGFHEVKISFQDEMKKAKYDAVISKKPFDSKALLKDFQLSAHMFLIEDVNQEFVTDLLLADEDYYIAIFSYQEKEDVKKHNRASPIAFIHTQTLEIPKVFSSEVSELTDHSFTLSWDHWEAPEKNLDNTPIQSLYDIYEVNQEKKSLLVKDIEEDFYSFQDMQAFTDYSLVLIRKGIIDGKVIISEESDEIKLKTLLPTVTNVSVTPTKTSSLNISWNPCAILEDTAKVTYSVYVSNTESENFQLKKDKINEPFFIDEGLTANTTYYYYVIASTTLNDVTYDSLKSEVASGKTNQIVSKPTPSKPAPTTPSTSGSTSSSSQNEQKRKEEEARKVAQEIASSILAKNYKTDLEKVREAAQIVSGYYQRGIHKESGEDYRTPYGVFIKGESSCAGTTRALGLVLTLMGYSWTHVNENQWTHQWLTLTMDGQIGFADGQVGIAGYGEWGF